MIINHYNLWNTDISGRNQQLAGCGRFACNAEYHLVGADSIGNKKAFQACQ